MSRRWNSVESDLWRKAEKYRDRERADRRSDAPLWVAPTPDIAALEAAANALTRHDEFNHAIALWAIALRLREEIKCPVT